MAAPVVALVATSMAVLAPSGAATADVPTFYKIGYGNLDFAYLVNPDGTNSETVARTANGHFDWTPDGEKLTLVGANGQILLRNQDGAEFPVGDVTGTDPELSPDGTRIAFTRFEVGVGDVVDVVDVQGNFIATLGQGRQPTWSPDGTKIAFAKRGERTVGCGTPAPNEITFASDGLAVAPATGGPSTWLIEPATPQEGSYLQVGSDPDWSPDGTAIVVHGSATEVFYNPSNGRCNTRGAGGDDVDVYKVSSFGGTPVNLTDDATWVSGTYTRDPADLNASFSPDGEQIAFASSRNTPRDGGIHSLWRMDADGGNPTLVKVANRVDETDWMTALPVGDVVRIKALDPCATEQRTTPGTFTIERTGVTDGAVDVTIALDPSSTATSGVDFPPIPTTVTIPDGTNLVNLVVFPHDDDIAEPSETLVVEIVSADGGLLVGEPSRATISIGDDDGGPPGECTLVTPPPSDECVDANEKVSKLKAKVSKQKKELRKAKKKDQVKKAKKLKKKVTKLKTKVKKAKKRATAACEPR